MSLTELVTLLIWGMLAAYLSLGIIVLLVAGMLKQELRRIQWKLEEIRRRLVRSG